MTPTEAIVRLPDARGPDGVPVTVRVEPAVARLRRWRRRLTLPNPLVDPFTKAVAYRHLPAPVQRRVLHTRWVVDIEADTGERCRLPATNRDEALARAHEVRASITRDGVDFLRTVVR
ncbi:MAG TPA: hypothetical protein VGE38_01105 [Nocardioides sp.]|uniref:hypothetical protein n=1 Tax=Nocardioides sp. TaxID=35761 RepID=UPI002EDB7575